MLYKVIGLSIVLLFLGGCSAVKEVADEGVGVIKNGSSTQERGESALEEKNRAIDLEL